MPCRQKNRNAKDIPIFQTIDRVLKSVDRVVEYRPDSVEYSFELLFRAGDAAIAASDLNRQYIHVFSGVFVYECLY